MLFFTSFLVFVLAQNAPADNGKEPVIRLCNFVGTGKCGTVTFYYKIEYDLEVVEGRIEIIESDCTPGTEFCLCLDALEACIKSWDLKDNEKYHVTIGIGWTLDPDFVRICDSKGDCFRVEIEAPSWISRDDWLELEEARGGHRQ